MSEEDKLKGRDYILPHGAYVVLADSSTTKDYAIYFKGEKILDVIAIVRMIR